MERTEMLEEEEEVSRNWIEKFKSMFAHGDEMEDEDEYEPAPGNRTAPRPAAPMRMDHTRGNAIYTRLSFHSMQDAQAAADRLKERRAVVVNFERTDEEVARRGIDFISGVTYALDGFYEKVGEKVFLFTPANTAIVVDDSEPATSYGAYDAR
jgi:cell division inhibitor SepF